MEKFTRSLLRHRKAVIALYAVLFLFSALLLRAVSVNYNLASYLPDSSYTKRGIEQMEESFGYGGQVRVMAENVSVAEALEVKAALEAIDGVGSVLWLDDAADIHQPVEMLSKTTVEPFYKDGAALFQVTFSENDYALSTGEAIEAIRALPYENLAVSGAAEEARAMRALLSSEITTIMLVVVPFCVLLLLLFSNAWIEPVIYLVVLFVAIVLNMGTNIFFSSISFITHAMASVLQLAIALDYSLFLFHRYLEERDAGNTPLESVVHATVKSLNSILASALTTVAGFLALVLMQYSIGRDIGLVLAKGICISLVTVLTLMPALLLALDKVIQKTRHRRWVPSFGRLGRGAMKLRYVLIIVLAVLIVPTFLASGQNQFLYGDSSGVQGDAASDRARIEARFGISNPVVLLVPTGDPAREAALAEALEIQPAVTGVQSLATLADPALPKALLPDSIVSKFQSETHARIIVSLSITREGPALTQATGAILDAAEAYYPGQWLAVGQPTSLFDIRSSVEGDSLRVQLLSILLVAVIVAVAFKSVTIPVLLVLLIQLAIWINMSVPYFMGTPLVYIGYLIISSLQLGATIDYAILLTNRYVEERRMLAPREAAVSALSHAGPSVLLSTLILSGAGFAEALLSRVSRISEIGLLLGRGALLSGLLVLVCLPPLLALLDKPLGIARKMKREELKA